MPKGVDLIEFNGIQSNLIRIALNPLNLMNLIRFRLFAAPGRKHQRNQWFNRGFWRSILARGWKIIKIDILRKSCRFDHK